jgi:predicted NAD/FAD-dependent oxidoreductase
MNRRKFLHQAGWLAAGTCAIPTLFQSCKKSDWEQEGKFQGEVIIIGAGIAGLYAAEMLIAQGVSVKVLEASSFWGGRMRTFPIAPQTFQNAHHRLIKGEFSILTDLLRHQHISLAEKTGSSLYYFTGTLNNETEANQNSFFQDMLQAVHSLSTFDGADITAQAYFEALDISSNVESVYNVLAGQVHGTSADRVSARGIAHQFNQWSSGEKEYVIDSDQLLAGIEKALPRVFDVIQYNTSIVSVDYTGNTIRLEDAMGASYACDQLLLTVPLQVLQSGFIAFTPALTNNRQNAFPRIGIDMCYCAMFKLQTAPWPLGTRQIIGGDLAQIFEVSDDGWVYAEVSGAQAETIASIFGDPLNIIQQEFEQLYPGAINQITESTLQQWQGNRSYDPVGVGDAREVIASSINNKIFFAGEATHLGGHHGTMHGAMETSLRAVTEILQGAGA